MARARRSCSAHWLRPHGPSARRDDHRFPRSRRGWTLCVDFGTAFSKAAAAPRRAWRQFDPAMVRPLTLNGVSGDGNPFLLDSAVFIDDERILFGAAAVRRAEELEHKKRQALRSFKTLLSAPDLERALKHQRDALDRSSSRVPHARPHHSLPRVFVSGRRARRRRRSRPGARGRPDPSPLRLASLARRRKRDPPSRRGAAVRGSGNSPASLGRCAFLGGRHRHRGSLGRAFVRFRNPRLPANGGWA